MVAGRLSRDLCGENFAVVRKNTFLEVVPRMSSSSERALSEPARNRDCGVTVNPKDLKTLNGLEERSTDIGSSCALATPTNSDRGSPLATPTLMSRNIAVGAQNFNFWNPNFSGSPSGSPTNQNESMDWNSNFDQASTPMFNGGNGGNLMDWNNFQSPMDGQQYGDHNDWNMKEQKAHMQHMHQQMRPGGKGGGFNNFQHGGKGGGYFQNAQDAYQQSMMQKMDKKGKFRQYRNSGFRPGPPGSKVFVGGLSSKTTEDTLVSIFSQFGEVAHASVLLDSISRRSRGFGYVTFGPEGVPEGVCGRDHEIDGKSCGARLYTYN